MLGRTLRGLLGAALIDIAGCGDQTPIQEGHECADVVQPGRDDERPPVDEIVIPMRAVVEGAIYGVGDVDVSGPEPRLQLEHDLVLAVGEGYPSTFTLVAPQSLWTSCGMLDRAITLHAVSGATDAIAAVLTDSAITFEVRAVGTADVSVTGAFTLGENTCDLPADTQVALDVHVFVRAVQPAGTTLWLPFECGEGVPLVAPSTRNFGLRARLLDDEGESFGAANADADAQVTLRLRGSFAAAHSEPTSLADWIAPPRSGQIEVVPAIGAPLRIDVVDGARITDAVIEFQQEVAKVRVVLEPGATYGEDGWGYAHNRIVPIVERLAVDGAAVCSPPSPDWFVLQSSTPETCSVVCSDADESDREGIGQTARLRADGTCSLVVRAPELTALPDLSSLTATFHNVAELQDF